MSHLLSHLELQDQCICDFFPFRISISKLILSVIRSGVPTKSFEKFGNHGMIIDYPKLNYRQIYRSIT